MGLDGLEQLMLTRSGHCFVKNDDDPERGPFHFLSTHKTSALPAHENKKRKKHTRMSTEWSPPNPAASPQEIEAAKTEKGGYDAKSLRKLGVPWPPPRSWRSRLVQAWKEQNPSESAEGLKRTFVKSSSPCPENGNKVHPWVEITTEKNKVRVFRCTKCGSRCTKLRAKTL